MLFSVFIGVYGPRLGNRQQIPAGTTLPELAAALQPKHTLRVVETRSNGTNLQWERQDRAPNEVDDAASRAAEGAEMVGNPVALPKLGGYRVRWDGPERVRVPGAAGALYFVSARRIGGARVGTRDQVRAEVPSPSPDRAMSEPLYASLLILEDEDRFTVFDRFARPQPMPEGEVFSVATTAATASSGGAGAGAGLVHAFRAGPLVYAVQATDEVLAADLVAELEWSAAETR